MISVIIPTLNDARYLPRTLASLMPGVGGILKEVIVADAGSEDETLAIADEAGCAIVRAGPGRAKRMRAGADVAKGKFLLFLHADTALGSGWAEETQRFIDTPQSRKRAAVFQLAVDDTSSEANRVKFWGRLRGRVMKVPYGEQGLLISRFFYDGLGGYPDVAQMEDVEIMRRIGPQRFVQLETQAITSAEKYRGEGRKKSGWRNLGLMARYMMGADPVELAKAYD